MGRHSLSALAAALALACVFAVTVAAQTGPRILPAAGAQTAPARASTPAPATYVGGDTCLGCHDDTIHGFDQTPHGKASDPRTPAAAQGCETCHGPGSRHVDDPSDDTTIRKFTKMSPRDVNATCLTCHTRSEHAAWQGSTHDARNLSCINCHSVHNFHSETAQLKTATQTQLCATCHRVQAAKTQRAAHMPLAEGKMECTTCHNPHGSTNVRMLKSATGSTRAACRATRRSGGPFLFEHAAGRESCVSCHDPHGSSNDRLLVAKLPMLCQRCHIGTRHPSTIYDNLSIQSKSVRIVDRGCVNCHSQIHGSNHPSGQTFTR